MALFLGFGLARDPAARFQALLPVRGADDGAWRSFKGWM
jgi:hypothetical protein